MGKIAVGVRLEQEIFDKLQVIANNEDRSINWLVSNIVEKYLKGGK